MTAGRLRAVLLCGAAAIAMALTSDHPEADNPAVLTERGLAPALDALAAKVPVPVTVDADGPVRL